MALTSTYPAIPRRRYKDLYRTVCQKMHVVMVVRRGHEVNSPGSLERDPCGLAHCIVPSLSTACAVPAAETPAPASSPRHSGQPHPFVSALSQSRQGVESLNLRLKLRSQLESHLIRLMGPVRFIGLVITWNPMRTADGRTYSPRNVPTQS